MVGLRVGNGGGGNELTRRLGVRYPIIQGGLAYVGNGTLAGAISAAGGFGQVGSGGRSPEGLAREISLAFETAAGTPFGVNLPLGEHADREPYVAAIVKEAARLRAVSLSAGNPRPYIRRFQDAGLAVMVLVSTPEQAVKAVQAGADIVVAEGYEAGGHNGPAELTTLTLVPQVVREAGGVPVVAAGGIASGAGVAAALSLGASGVQLGTRFVATRECEAHERYKRRIVEGHSQDTLVMERSIGRVTRVLDSPWVREVLRVEEGRPGIETLLPYIRGERNRVAAIGGELEEGWLNCGQCVGLIDDLPTAGELVGRLVRETAEALEGARRLWDECGSDQSGKN